MIVLDNFIDFYDFQGIIAARLNDFTVLWQSMTFDQRDMITAKFKAPKNITTEQVARYYPEIAAFVLGMK